MGARIQTPQSFDGTGDTARYPAAPPRLPATGVADIDDAGTLHAGGVR